VSDLSKIVDFIRRFTDSSINTGPQNALWSTIRKHKSRH